MHPTLAAGIGAFLGLAAASHAGDACWVYFGSSARDENRGIYVSKLDEDTGSISPAQRVANKPDSEFIAFSPDKGHLYSVAEAGYADGEAIESYAVDKGTGRLRHLGERAVGGPVSCHISVDPSGRCVLTANYDGAYVEAFPILADSTVGERTCMVRHSGNGLSRPRQDSAHPHSVNVDPTGRFAVVADLGTDKLYIYRLDAARALLTRDDPGFVRALPGSGPRHFAFHPDGKHAFAINELAGSVTVYGWDSRSGALTPGETVSILGSGFHGKNTSAEVVVAKDGRHVYASNRGEDSLVSMAFDAGSGRLTFSQRMQAGVKTPRNFAIDPSGHWLVCGNLGTNRVTIYRIESLAGNLTLRGTIPVPEPLCIRFVQI